MRATVEGTGLNQLEEIFAFLKKGSMAWKNIERNHAKTLTISSKGGITCDFFFSLYFLSILHEAYISLMSFKMFFFLKHAMGPGQCGWLSWLEHHPVTEGLRVRFRVGAHA